MNLENKNSFFSVVLGIPDTVSIEELENEMDLVLSLMNVQSMIYKFEQNQKEQLVYFFKTANRKRKGQLVKYCDRIISHEFKVHSFVKTQFETEIERLKQNRHFNLINQPTLFGDYTGKDVKFFEDRKTWHPWQHELYSKIFNPDGTFQIPNPRKIISLVDTQGNSGKSSFFKFLYFKHPSEIGKIGYGTASQLRTSFVNVGRKTLYIVDLARSKGRDDKQADILSALEDAKNGAIFSAMMGAGKTLLMEPPHIIISTNYKLDYGLLSADRWDTYNIQDAKLKEFKYKEGVSPKK